MARTLTSLIVSLLINGAVAADRDTQEQISRDALLDRYAHIFAARTMFDEQQVIALEEDTRRYFYEQEVAGTSSKDLNLARLHSKLLLYLNFFQINIKARGYQLSGWNYYRLLLDALRVVDHRYLTAPTGKARHYHRLLQENVTAHMWRAVRTYQEHFPFLHWDFCARVAASCPQQSPATSWETRTQVVAVLNIAIDRLNRHVRRLQLLAKSRSLFDDRGTYQQAVQNYLRTYEELLAKPYGGLLLMISEQQQRKLLATPALFGNYTLVQIDKVDSQTVQDLFAAIAALFAARMEKLNSLYDSDDRKALLSFVIKYHRQALAEFLIKNPRFFNIINYYLDLVNSEYEEHQRRAAAVRRDSGFMVAGGVGLGYAALHHFLRFSKGQVLYFVALMGGAAATAYAALQQRSFLDLFAVREQVHGMHNSLIMRQSHDLLHFLHQLRQLAQVRRAAWWQGGMLTVYALFFARHLRKARHLQQQKNLHRRGASLLKGNKSDVVIYRGFDLRAIGKTMDDHRDLLWLSSTERIQLAEELFGNYRPFRQWRKQVGRDMSNLDDQQIEALRDVSHKLKHIFAPNEDNVAEIAAQVGTGYAEKTIKDDLDKITFFIHHLFDVGAHRHGIPPSR